MPAGLRILVMSADIGAGHLTVARSLTEELRERPEVGEVALTQDLTVMGTRFGRFLTGGFHTHLDGIGWTYDLAYRAFFAPALPRRAGQLALATLGHRGVAATLRRHRPDRIVTEYPLLSAALGELRLLGRLHVPVISSISDPAGLYYWAHPGVDLHLVSWPEAVAEVERIAGPGRAVAVAPQVDRRIRAAPERPEARRRLADRLGIELAGEPGGRDRGRPLVVVSGGGWGVGDLDTILEVARRAAPTAALVAVCGHNSELAERLRSRWDRDPGVRVLGYTDEMALLLGGADALIHTTGGTTALEARLLGCPLINYGTGVAHVRAHARALADRGIAPWARTPVELRLVLGDVLAQSPRPRDPTHDLPSAADAVLGLARAR